MRIGPQLPNELLDLEPLYGDPKPRQRCRRRAQWTPNQPSTQIKPSSQKPSSRKPPPKPLPPVKPPPPQPRELQNRPNMKGRNTKKAMFKVSFVEPQIRQQQDRQQQGRQPQKDQREAVNIRWHTINQSTKKLVRQKGSTTTSAEPPDQGGASTGSSINREKLLPTDCSIEPLEPLQYQKSI